MLFIEVVAQSFWTHISTYKRSQYTIVLASNFKDQKHLEDYLGHRFSTIDQ